MDLRRFRIRDVRNIADAELEMDGGINAFIGPNGSGKTSILEAVYLLARGSSFRERKGKPVIREGADCAVVYGVLKDRDGREKRIGVRKGAHTIEAKIDGERVRRLSDIALATPLAVITPRSHELLERGPEYRRRLIDWGVFHVEHSYREIFERFNRVLAQRNSALKKRAQTEFWDMEFARLGSEVNLIRSTYLLGLESEFRCIMERFMPEVEFSFTWRSGWGGDDGLLEKTQGSRDLDQRFGFTHFGPQRADLELRADGRRSTEVLSRGELKIAITALIIAQVNYTRLRRGIDTIVMFDDLGSELDRRNREGVLRLLSSATDCALVTAIESSDLPGDISRLFHVEHGTVRR